jgi:hypothetical protein
MEQIFILSAFYDAISNDARIGATHISLYMALFHSWGLNNFQNPIAFTSQEIMPKAKIDSRATYHYCLRDLVECGYIRYVPSCNPFLKSLAFMGTSVKN